MAVIPNTRGNPQATDIAVQQALPLAGSASREDLQAVLTLLDSDLAKLFEDRNILLTQGGTIAYTGTTVTFTEALKLELNSRIAGGSPVVIDLGSTTRTISADGRMIYAVIDRIAGTATVTDDAATLPSVVAANQEVFLIAKRRDTGGAVKRLYFRTGMALNEGQSASLGASGSGGGGSLTVQKNGSNVQTSVSTINIQGNANVTSPSAGVVDIRISEDGGSDLNSVLNADENDSISSTSPNIFIDDFGDEEKGTKSNVSQSSSALRLNSGQTTGYYERTRETTATITNIDGLIVASLQALAPKNTAASPSSTASSVDFKFAGDVTEFFPVSKDCVFLKEIVSDGKLRQIYLTNAAGFLAKLPVSARSYSSGPDETTVTFTNSAGLDLDLDVSSGNYNAQLRVKPFDYLFQAKTTSGGSYENLEITDANIYEPATVRIPGENFFRELSGLTGRALNMASNSSKNGQYAIVRIWEQRSDLAAHPYHWFYTADRGASWTKFSTTKDSNNKSAFIDQYGPSAHQGNDENIFVANNGKMFSTYLWQSGSGFDQVRAVYSDLSAGTPALTDSADRGLGAGIVVTNASNNLYGPVKGDIADASFIAVQSFNSDVPESGGVFYSNGGATFLSVSSNTLTTSPAGALQVTGSGTSHRAHLVVRNGSGFLNYHYIDQGTYTWSSATSIEASDSLIYGSSILNDRFVILYRNTSYTNLKFGTFTTSFGVAPGTVVKGTLTTTSSLLTADDFIGWSATTNIARQIQRLGGKTLVQNPTNEKHCFFVCDLNGTSENVRRPYVFEVEDVTNFRGTQISQYTAASAASLNDTSARTRIGQTFTASATGQKVRAIGASIFRNGTAAITGTVTCHIYNTSAGLPTTIIASSLNTLDVSKLNAAGNASWMYFRFNNIDLTNGVQYAIVLSTTQSVDATNPVRWNNANANSYAGGAPVQYDGATWTLSGTTSDYTFEVIGDYVIDIGLDNPGLFGQNTINQFNNHTESQQTQIHLLDSSSSNIILSTRRYVDIGNNYRPFQGHIFRGVGTIGTPSSSPSQFSSLIISGYAPGNYDANLTYAVACGTDTCAQLSVAGTPGVIDTAKKAEDRSGMCVRPNTYTNVVAGDFVADASFQSGFCFQGNGSNKTIQHFSDANIHNFESTRPFAIEVEFKLSNLTGTQSLITKYSTSFSYGWYFIVNSSGQIIMELQNSGGATIGQAQSVTSTIAINTYYVGRVVYNGTGAPRIYLSTTGPSGTFTEVSYSNQVNFSGSTVSTQDLAIGSAQSGSFLGGKVGYIKIAKGTYGATSISFNYAGFKSQPANQITNIGTRLVAVQMIGKNNYATGSSNEQYQDAGIIDGQYANQASVVDSYDSIFKIEQFFGTSGKGMYSKNTMNRVSNRNQSSIQGLIQEFKK